MANPKLIAEVEIDEREALRSLKNLETQGDKTAKGLSGSFSGKVAAGFIGAQIAIAAVSKAFTSLRQSFSGMIEAAATQEAAVVGLNAALVATGNYSAEASRELQSYASSLQSVTTIGDETTLTILKTGSAVARLSNDQLPKFADTVVQVSKLYGLSMESASLLVAKSLTSTTNAMSRYGITIDVTASKQDKLNQLFEATQAGMSLAIAETNTYEGAVQQLQNIWGDLNETIGRGISQSPVVVNTIKAVTAVIQTVIQWVEKWQASNSELASTMQNQLGDTAKEVMLAISDIMIAVVKGAFSAKSAIEGFIGSTLKFFAEIARGIGRILEGIEGGVNFVLPAINAIGKALGFLKEDIKPLDLMDEKMRAIAFSADLAGTGFNKASRQSAALADGIGELGRELRSTIESIDFNAKVTQDLSTKQQVLADTAEQAAVATNSLAGAQERVATSGAPTSSALDMIAAAAGRVNAAVNSAAAATRSFMNTVNMPDNSSAISAGVTSASGGGGSAASGFAGIGVGAGMGGRSGRSRSSITTNYGSSAAATMAMAIRSMSGGGNSDLAPVVGGPGYEAHLQSFMAQTGLGRSRTLQLMSQGMSMSPENLAKLIGEAVGDAISRRSDRDGTLMLATAGVRV